MPAPTGARSRFLTTPHPRTPVTPHRVVCASVSGCRSQHNSDCVKTLDPSSLSSLHAACRTHARGKTMQFTNNDGDNILFSVASPGAAMQEYVNGWLVSTALDCLTFHSKSLLHDGT